MFVQFFGSKSWATEIVTSVYKNLNVSSILISNESESIKKLDIPILRRKRSPVPVVVRDIFACFLSLSRNYLTNSWDGTRGKMRPVINFLLHVAGFVILTYSTRFLANFLGDSVNYIPSVSRILFCKILCSYWFPNSAFGKCTVQII